jgi:ABC-type bacteriocin/lantibiotic exporter with double-glycine peptidase domain
VSILLGLLAAAQVQLAVPFVPQDKDTCGAASLTMVMRYWGDDVTHDHVVSAIVEASHPGIAGSRLEAFARARGYLALAYASDAAQLRESLEKGRPLIVALRVGKGLDHDVVVTGLDAEGAVTLHDPAVGRDRQVAKAEFEKRWSGTGHWALLVLPQP